MSTKAVTRNTRVGYIAEKLLRGLGSQVGLIKHITIDVSPLCHLECEDEPEVQHRVDILPLLRLKRFYYSVDIRLTHQPTN